MADYYPLIARAVTGLEKNTGEARRALYERARTALVVQTPTQAQITGTGWIGNFYNNTALTGAPLAANISYPNRAGARADCGRCAGGGTG